MTHSTTRSTTHQTDVNELVAGARRGDRRAWNALVERFLPMIRAAARSYRLNERDAEDVGQTVCMRLVENLGRIREPQALPKWIMTATRHESLRVATSSRRMLPVDPLSSAIDDIGSAAQIIDDHELLLAEQSRALRAGLAELPAAQRDLLLLLCEDQALSYREIGRRLAMPVGSIGPTRARGLARLRSSSAIRDYLDVGCPNRRATRPDRASGAVSVGRL
jgi:RNA polymerase sigma factor (sigma-70 family)